MTVSLDGEAYDSGMYAVAIDVEPTIVIQNVSLYAPDGKRLVASLNFRHWTTVTNSGRAHYTVQHWELLSGSLGIP